MASIPLGSAAEATARGLRGVSEWFTPFLPVFLGETLRCGGTARVVPEDGPAQGLLLQDSASGVGSLFARSAEAATLLARECTVPWLFSEVDLGGPSEVYRLFHRRLAASAPPHRSRHAVRLARPDDHAPVLRLLRSELGGVDERWFRGLPSELERGFVCEMDGELAGAAWLLAVGRYGRLHSLAVAPRFRRLGVGTDLMFARLEWAAAHGVEELLSEIAEENVPSAAIARQGGMAAVGRWRLFRRGEPGR